MYDVKIHIVLPVNIRSSLVIDIRSFRKFCIIFFRGNSRVVVMMVLLFLAVASASAYIVSNMRLQSSGRRGGGPRQ